MEEGQLSLKRVREEDTVTIVPHVDVFSEQLEYLIKIGTATQLRDGAQKFMAAALDREGNDHHIIRVCNLPPMGSYADQRQYLINVLSPVHAKNIYVKQKTNSADIRFYDVNDKERGLTLLIGAGIRIM